MTTKTTKTPTDLELMLYADGELEGEPLAAVEAWLAEDRSARQKMIALGLVGDVVREQAKGAAPKADDLADLVMASIAAEAKRASAPAAALKEAPAQVAPPRRRAANDNARGLWTLAAVAVAAAAGLLLWSRGPAQDHGGGVASSRAPAPALTAPASSDVAKVEAPRPEGDVDHGVEVAAVNFGAHMGAVFYVPSDTAADTTTTVVWLSDDSSGGNE